MPQDRRTFLKTAGLAGAGLAATGLGGGNADAAQRDPGEPARSPSPSSHRGQAPAPKRMLILGGTGFIGPHTVRYAVERGHEVTIFTRGNRPSPHPDVEALVGDRNDDLSALEGRRWDVVLDNNANDYRWVQLSTQLLKDATDHYLYVSSISAYQLEGFGYERKDQVLWQPEVTEESQVWTPGPDFKDGDEAPFGLTKALSERIASEAFPGRTTVVRPGLIVGPGDRSDRFTYWPVRIDEGGEVLAPGNPRHANQIIDQRDLTEWIVRMAEAGTPGVFNATGPASRMSMAEMLYGIRGATSGPVSFTWVSEDFLEANEVRPWADLPSWIPGDPLMLVDIQRALDAGLTFRPLAVTTRDTLDWYYARPEEERANPRSGMSRDRERDLLEAWHAQG